MKNKLFFFLSFSFLTSLGLSFTRFESIAKETKATPIVNQAIVESEWSTVGSPSYRIEGETIVASGNTNKNHNYFLHNNYDARGSYDIAMSFSGSESLPVGKTMDIGIVPWYIDTNNYIIVYLNWTDQETRPHELREIQVTGRLNGEELVRTENNSPTYIKKEWCDIWMDGVVLSPTSFTTLKINKTRDKNDNSDSMVITLNDTVKGTIKFRDLSKFDLKKSRCGVYVFNDVVTISDFTFTSIDTNGIYQPLANGNAKSTNNSFAYNDNQFTFNTLSTSNAFDNMYIQDNSNLGYMLTYDLSITNKSSNYSFGSVVNYVDEYTYLSALIKVEGTTVNVGFIGTIKGLLLVDLNPIIIEDFVTINQTISNNVSLKVIKDGANYYLYLNDVLVASHSYSNFFDAGKVGIALSGIEGTISNFSCEYNFAEYSWEQVNINSIPMNVSGRLSNSIQFINNEFVFSSNAITVGNTDQFARVYYTSNYYGNINLSATFKEVTNLTRFGLIPYLNNVDDYISCSIIGDELLLIHHQPSGDEEIIINIESELSEAPTDVTLEVKLALGKLDITLNGILLAESISFTDLVYDESSRFNVGLLVGATEAKVSPLSVSGFSPLDPLDNHDFTFFGQRPSSWNYDYENKVISNQLIEGVANGWKATNALYRNSEEKKDLYIASRLQVTKAEGSEFKIGLMPYYKDADNHVIVWLSQWAGQGVKVVMTGRLFGTTMGAEWRESGDTGINLFDNNYLEVYIHGEEVSLFVNRSFEPIFKTTFLGLGERDMSESFTGFQVGNGMQGTFSEFTMISDSRVFTFSDKPEIIETGTRPTEGVVGTSIKLPIYTASNASGDVLNPIVSVNGPNGEEVSLSKNAFVPTTTGEYVVSVVCYDNWGNVNDPYSYVITVKEGEIKPDDGGKTPEGDDKDDKNNNGSAPIIITSVSVGSVVVIAGAVLLILKLRKKK